MLREESHYRLSLTYLKNKFLPLSPQYRDSNFLHISIIIIRVPSCPSCLFVSLQYLAVSRMHIFSLIFLSCRFCFTRCILKSNFLIKVITSFSCTKRIRALSLQIAAPSTHSKKQDQPTPHPLNCWWSLSGDVAGLWPNLSRKIGHVWIKMKALSKSWFLQSSHKELVKQKNKLPFFDNRRN